MPGSLQPEMLPGDPDPKPMSEIADEQGLTPETLPKSRRSIGRERRLRSLKASWGLFRTSWIGLAGLVVLCLFILIALAAPLLVPRSGTVEAVTVASGSPRLSPPVPGYPLGTDKFGRSISTMLIWGAQVSLLVGALATMGAMLIGAAVGICAGFFGGRIDALLMRLTDWFLVIPWLALALVLASILGPTLLNVVVVISVTTWAFTARVVRAQALTVKSRPYVERAKALGSSNWHVITRHVLPNTFPIIFAQTILIAASAILTEATLAFLGLGDPQSVSWGKMLEEGFNQGAITTGRLWLIIPPGVCIVLLVLSLTMIGYAFDQILNPRLRDR